MKYYTLPVHHFQGLALETDILDQHLLFQPDIKYNIREEKKNASIKFHLKFIKVYIVKAPTR